MRWPEEWDEALAVALNAEPVAPGDRTTHLGHSIIECEVLTGT